MSFDWGDRLPTLTAPRVELRHLRAGDAPEVFAIFSDPEVMRYWDSPPHRDLADAASYVDEIDGKFRSRTLFQWGVARREEDRVVGTCTLFHLDAGHRRAELGFALARAVWGQGLMSEALAALLGFAFDTLALHRLEADVDPRNERSLRALERLGFRREGYLRERYHLNGETQDTVFLGLLAREWPGRLDP